MQRLLHWRAWRMDARAVWSAASTRSRRTLVVEALADTMMTPRLCLVSWSLSHGKCGAKPPFSEARRHIPLRVRGDCGVADGNLTFDPLISGSRARLNAQSARSTGAASQARSRLVIGRGNVAVRRLANPVTFCDGHGASSWPPAGRFGRPPTWPGGELIERGSQHSAGDPGRWRSP
jgi:hypothetical protein